MELKKENSRRRENKREIRQASCDHDWTATFQGGDTYKCKKCGKTVDMTEE